MNGGTEFATLPSGSSVQINTLDVGSDGRHVSARLVQPVGWITLIDSDSGERRARRNCESHIYWCIISFTDHHDASVTGQELLIDKNVLTALGEGFIKIANYCMGLLLAVALIWIFKILWVLQSCC